MITNDFIKFVASNEIDKRPNKEPRKSEMKKGGNFEEILSSKKEVSNFSPNSKNSFKSDFVKSQNFNEKKINFRENTTKDQFKKSDYSLNNRTEPNKTTESKKLVENQENENDLKCTDENVGADKAYDYLASLMTGLVNLDETKALEDLDIDEVQNSELNILSTDLAITTDIASTEDNIVLNQNLEDLTDLDETNNEMVFDLDLEQIQPPKQEKKADSLKEEEPIELQSLTTKELETFKLNSNIKNNNDGKHNDGQNEEQNKISVEHSILDEEEIDFLQNSNKEKASRVNNNVQINEDFEAEAANDVKIHNIFNNFNDNIHSHLENRLDNVFKTIVNENSKVLDKDSIFQQIVEKVKVDLDKTDEIRIKLKPDFLGEISLKISTEKGIVTAKAFVENYNVKQIIESNLDNLKDNMRELGINFEALDVSVGKDSGFDKNNSQAWKQEQKIKVRKSKLESIPVAPTYEEDMNTYVGGLYSSNGNIDLIV